MAGPTAPAGKVLEAEIFSRAAWLTAAGSARTGEIFCRLLDGPGKLSAHTWHLVQYLGKFSSTYPST
jgi:hypothetical protein